MVLSAGLINVPYLSVTICWPLWVSPVLTLPATLLPPFAISHRDNDNIQSGYWQFSPLGCIWGFLVLTCHLIWYLSCLAFSEFLDGTVVWCLLRILGNSQSLLLQIFLCTLPTSPITHVKHFALVSENQISVSFSFLFSLCISVSVVTFLQRAAVNFQFVQLFSYCGIRNMPDILIRSMPYIPHLISLHAKRETEVYLVL